ncbi:MAG: hypothetical protein OFPII_06590 [Osedax symbiont Rs1]|nr:MAG: hypothetical protein OFPII_06590 [Osedax symbiont Rs1]
MLHRGMSYKLYSGFSGLFFLKKKETILVAAIIEAVITETILTSTQMIRSWGKG